MKELRKRVLTALLMATVGVSAVILSPYGFGVAAIILLGMLVIEFSTLTHSMTRYSEGQQKWIYPFRALLGIGIFTVVFIWQVFDINLLLLLAIVPILSILPELFIASTRAFTQMLLGIFSLAYIAMPITFAILIVYPDGRYDPSYLIGILLLVWCNDIMAFFVGKSLGKRPLAEKISPKKTLEGALGGIIGTVGFSFLIAFLWPAGQWFDWIALALITAVSAILGDLAESLMKRNLKVKDSGSILPGHGGLMDRFDSMLFSIPAVLIYLLYRNII